MKNQPADVVVRLTELFELLIRQPMLRRGAEWKGKWDGWDDADWNPACCGVYILWENDSDLENGIAPVYVGEGITGTRVWDSFQRRIDWRYAQVFYHDTISQSDDSLNWRRLLG